MRVSVPDGGKYLQLVEREFAAMFGVRHAVAVNSATSGLHAALVAVGVGPGDVVLVSGLTMTASAAAVFHAGGIPVFADVSAQTGLSTPQNWQDAFDYSQTTFDQIPKAAVVVHLFGQACDITGMLLEMAVVEDAAQAPWCVDERGRFLGTLGHAGVFSLNQDKIITCGEGGVCVTPHDYLADRMKLVRNHGENHSSEILGYNYRMTEIEAAVAYHEIMDLANRQQTRLHMAILLAKALEESERYVPMDVMNPPYVFYALDMEKKAVDAPPGWKRGYTNPLCCCPYFKARLNQSCLEGAHEFNAKSLVVKCPKNEGEVEALATALLERS